MQAGEPLEILREEAFLARLGLHERLEDIHRLYTTQQLSRILKVPVAQVRAWVRHGLITPEEAKDKLANECAEVNCLWLEEPLPASDIHGFRALARNAPVPIATGEHHQGAVELAPLFDARASMSGVPINWFNCEKSAISSRSASVLPSRRTLVLPALYLFLNTCPRTYPRPRPRF